MKKILKYGKQMTAFLLAVILTATLLPTEYLNNIIPAKLPWMVKAAEIVHSGTDGDLEWSIDSEGCLRINGSGNYINHAWTEYFGEIKKAVVNVTDITTTNEMFYDCSFLRSIDLTGLDTRNVTDMSKMFYSCSGIESLNLSGFDTRNVTDMSDMFNNSFGMTSLNLSSFNTSKVTNMGRMFCFCSSLKELDLSSFNTSNVTDMEAMFYYCRNIINLDLSKFNITGVKRTTDMFTYCFELEKINTPINTAFAKGILPTEEGKQWIDSSGKAYSVLPGNIDHSIKLMGALAPRKYSDIGGTLTHSKKDNSGTGTVYLSYDENDFSESSYNYNHNLAEFAIGLSTMAYSSDENMEGILEKLNYKKIEKVKDESPLKAATSPFWICHKKVKLNEQITELMLVIIQGTYHEEWLDNFDSGTGHTHVGFQRAADNVLKKMSEYITNPKNNIDKNSDLKILVTGHSRGAATANLVGRALDDQTSIGNINYDSNDIFVYTFATPNVTSLTQRKEQKYQNIFNIVNPEDFVTKVLPSGWGYGRYGITYVLPSSTTDVKAEGNYVKYSSYLVNLQEHFKWTRPNDSKGYIPYPNGMGNVSTYVKDVTNTVQTINQYYMMSLCTYVSGVLKESSDSLHNLYKYTLGGICSNNKEYENLGYAMIAKVSFGGFGWIGLRTVEFFIVNHVKDPKFDCAHYPETYLAAMQCLTREQLTGANRKMLKGIVNCPVDVTITDYEGSVVGRTINDQVDENIENGITMTVEGDSKTFYLPKDMEFNIKLTGNDNGIMDYSLCEYDPDTGETGRAYYQDIPVNTGVSFTQEVFCDARVDEVPLKDRADNIVSPTKVMDNTEIGTLSVDVSVEGIGSANSMIGLTEGDHVTVSAVTDENNEFLGWYDELGRFITKDADYSFSIHENEKLTAKFTDITVATKGFQFEKNNVNMDVDEYLFNNATVIPSNATDKNLYYSSSNDSVVTVDDFGMLHALAIGKAVITAKDISGKYTAQCEVTVGKVDEPVNNLPGGEKETIKPTVAQNKAIKISLSGISKQIAAGKKIRLTAQGIPLGAPLPNLTWSTSNPKVATVTQTGVVTVKKNTGGKTVTITATAADGSGISASWKIKSMKGVVKKIAVTGAKTVKAGKSLKLKAKVTATKGANKKLKWTSSNTKYATVTSSGKVKTFKAGKGKKVKITAMAMDGSNKKKTVTIKMK